GGAEDVVGGGAEEVVGVTGAEEVVGVTAAELVVAGAAVVVVAAAVVAVVVVVAFLCAFLCFFFLFGSFFLWGVVVLDFAADVEVELELPELPQPASSTAAARVVSSARFMIGLPLSIEDFGPGYKRFRCSACGRLHRIALPVANGGPSLAIFGPPAGPIRRQPVLYNDRRPARLRDLGGKAAPPTNLSGTSILRRFRPRPAPGAERTQSV